MEIERLRRRLQSLNESMAGLTGLPPAELAFQTGGGGDDLFLYGIVGGKDVGKTSLINQLAGARISVDTDILDEGTKTAVAYCHEKDQPALMSRLGPDAAGRVECVPHARTELKNVVLLDFPDFDSRFAEHREDVIRFSKHLQGMVWVTSPRKYGDHEFLRQLETVAQSHEYYFIVFNKVDQVAGEAGLAEIRGEVRRYIENECERRRVPAPAPDRFFLVSAIDPSQYDYKQLHDRLVRIHSPEEIAKAKIENLKSEFEKNLAALRGHFGLDSKVEAIDAGLEWLQDQIRETFSEEYFETVQARLAQLDSPRRRIGANLFAKRVQTLPLLWILYYPLSGLFLALGGMLTFQRRSEGGEESPRELLRFRGASASSLIQSIANEAAAEFPAVAGAETRAEIDPAEVDKRFGGWLREYEERVTQRLASEIRPAGHGARAALYLPLLWFPFLQPILFALADGGADNEAGLSDAIGAAIGVFGASSLLTSLLFLLLLYSVILLAMYSASARKAEKAGGEEFQLLWYERLMVWVWDELSRPWLELRGKLAEKQMELDSVEESIHNELERLRDSRPWTEFPPSAQNPA